MRNFSMSFFNLVSLIINHIFIKVLTSSDNNRFSLTYAIDIEIELYPGEQLPSPLLLTLPAPARAVKRGG